MILNNLTESELRELLPTIGEQAYRGSQIFQYIHRQNKNEIEEFVALPKSLRAKLESELVLGKMSILKSLQSQLDSTIKLLYQLEDGNIIEGVLLEYKHGYSLCISTQVGCRMGCVFCASTKGGLVRNLEPYEIASQLYLTEREFDISISNIILMGSGEPLDNYDNTIRALRLLHAESGKNLSYRSMTLSTCGIVKGIDTLRMEDIPINLAISIHSFDDEKRSEILPINKKYSVAEVVDAARRYVETTGRRVTFEYTVIQGSNDRDVDIDLIYKYTKGIESNINLIALNPIKEYDKTRVSDKSLNEFKRKLEKRNLNATIRRELGSDISASCGQLRREFLNDKEEVNQ